jgi:hypothetical protein
MQNEFKSKLLSVKLSAIQARQNTNDINEIRKEALKELDIYTRVIPDFFSYNSEAVRIKTMYKKLKELDYIRNRVIPCINVDYATRIYNEYLDGMSNFIKDYCEKICRNDCDLSLMEKQLDTAIQGDPLFIQSLFGGKNNESTNEELTYAVTNVEFLVDFLECIKNMINTINCVCDRCMTCPTCPQMVNSVRLITNSICCFSNCVIDTIMSIYEDINNSLDGKTTKATVDATFKLF